MNESSGFKGDTSVKTVKRESVKQLRTILNSVSQGQTWRHPCIETQHIKMTQGLKMEPLIASDSLLWELYFLHPRYPKAVDSGTSVEQAHGQHVSQIMKSQPDIVRKQEGEKPRIVSAHWGKKVVYEIISLQRSHEYFFRLKAHWSFVKPSLLKSIKTTWKVPITQSVKLSVTQKGSKLKWILTWTGQPEESIQLV